MSYDLDMLGDFEPDKDEIAWYNFQQAYGRYLHASDHRFQAALADEALNEAYKVVTLHPGAVEDLIDNIFSQMEHYTEGHLAPEERNIVTKANALLDRIMASQNDLIGTFAIPRGAQTYFELGIIRDAIEKEDVQEVHMQLDYLTTNHAADAEIIEPFKKIALWIAQYDLNKAMNHCRGAWTRPDAHEEMIRDASELEYRLVTQDLAYIDRDRAQSKLGDMIGSDRIEETLKEKARNFIDTMETLATMQPRQKQAAQQQQQDSVLLNDAWDSWTKSIRFTGKLTDEEMIDEMEAVLNAAELCMGDYPTQTHELLRMVLQHKLKSDIPALQENMVALTGQAKALQARIHGSKALSTQRFDETFAQLAPSLAA